MPTTLGRLPGDAGTLLLTIVRLLRVEALLPERDRKALRRWASSGKPPKHSAIRDRIAYSCSNATLPAQRFTTVLGLPRNTAVEVIAAGVVAALDSFDRTDARTAWLRTVAATVACTLAAAGLRILDRDNEGASAKAPHWIFAGRRSNQRHPNRKAVRPASTAAGSVLRKEAKDRREAATNQNEKDLAELGDVVRKNLSSLEAGLRPHYETLDRISVKARTATYRFERPMEDALIAFRIDPASAILLASIIDSVADQVRTESIGLTKEKLLVAALGGLLFKLQPFAGDSMGECSDHSKRAGAARE